MLLNFGKKCLHFALFTTFFWMKTLADRKKHISKLYFLLIGKVFLLYVRGTIGGKTLPTQTALDYTKIMCLFRGE